MALPNRRSFSKEPSDIYLSGVLSSTDNPNMYGEYENDPKLPVDYPNLPALEYLDHYAALPADRPVGYPHLINTDKFKEENQRQNLRIADAIVTVLYNWEPEALAAFLDHDLEDFRFQVEDSNIYPHNFFVQRKGKRVECGYVGYESHEYWIEESGEWTPLSVIVQLRRCAQENYNAHQTATSVAHSAIDENYDSKEPVSRKRADGKVKRGHVKVPTAPCHRNPLRKGFIDKVQEKVMIDDGAKLADDVLALPVWAASPLIRFKTIGVQLSKKRKDTDALDG